MFFYGPLAVGTGRVALCLFKHGRLIQPYQVHIMIVPSICLTEPEVVRISETREESQSKTGDIKGAKL
jgi:hypothetical protein